MNFETHKNTIYSLLFITAVASGLSIFVGVAYIHTLCGISAWVAIGHLVTLDDDMPGEWSNMEGSSKVWRSSLVVLSVKIAVSLILFALTIGFPNLASYGT